MQLARERMYCCTLLIPPNDLALSLSLSLSISHALSLLLTSNIFDPREGGRKLEVVLKTLEIILVYLC